MITDMMTHFELYQPSRVEDALALLDRHGEEGWKMAGGNDSLDWFKDRIKHPKAVIDLKGIEELKGVREGREGIEIGALTTLTEIERHPVLRKNYGLLAIAARKVASPQIRNVSTIGGNVSQDTRCWYYREGLDCYRADGHTCYADTPEGMNRDHAIFSPGDCMAVSPSDTAPALVVLGAKMVIRSSKGERVVEAKDFFIDPSVDITKMTILEPGDILTAIRIPNSWTGAWFSFEKVSDRQTWDFALVNLASAMVVKGGVIERLSIACGGVECVPRRLHAVEDIVRGKVLSEEVADLAGKTAVQGAKPLKYNHFKITLMQNLVIRAIRGA